MKSVKLIGLALALVALATFAVPAPGSAGDAGLKTGFLTCSVSNGFGFVFGSSREVNCSFSPSTTGAKSEKYKGTIKKFGADIGYLNSAVMVWAVLAPTADAITPAALAGDYIGATGSATVGVGAGANVLVGGMHNSFTLQPVSIEGNTGLNVAAGVAALKLEPADSISKKRGQS